MKITDATVSKDKHTMTFVLNDATPAQANALRQSLIALVPTLAVEDVEFTKNNSALYDEVIAHRLGLLPLTTDLKSYKLRSEFPDDDVHRAECEVKISLEAKGPGMVYAEQIVSKDPSVKCAHPKMPIVELLKDQEVAFEAIAVLGQGKDHMKWSGANAYFQLLPVAKSGKKEHVVSPKDIQGQKNQEVFVTPSGSSNNAAVKVSNFEVEQKEGTYLFTVESWGQLPPQDMLKEAVVQLDKQVDDVLEAVKVLK